ncbi:cyclic nucleotide-binding domain protein [Lyngbya aestuarii BL J]|uniref:Cyclic nucleotide-binding domain protein n=1 Tax=Lyngbya aestuarii BL J TaxID=1348334 RepID=U7QKP3_9CYAN|nr:cyclic nucleotide-binding domain-containing protein [Lyngbya aestuarii]ERT07857.1 cyclic nucleotide-binding domain protein [Lyngbya aestuarii BL J]
MIEQPKKALFILGGLDDQDLCWIINRGKTQVIPPGETLIYEGRTISALYIVLKGALSVSISPNGERELARLVEGEVVGEISFIDNRPPLATVKALEESLVLVVPRFELMSQLHKNAGFASRFYQGICLCLASRMRGTVRRLGYEVNDHYLEDMEQDTEDMTESKQDFLELAEAKFNWLVENLKTS